MCEKKELTFSIFILYALAEKWQMSPASVYKILNTTGILDNYIIRCYDVLHTQGKEYLVEDIMNIPVRQHRKSGRWETVCPGLRKLLMRVYSRNVLSKP